MPRRATFTPARDAERQPGTARPRSPLQALADAAPQAARLARLQQAADHGPQQAAQLKLAGRPLQRAAVEEEEPLQGKVAQRQEGPGLEEEEPVQSRAAQRKPDTAAPNRTGMPDGLKSGIEALSGLDMSEVRVRANSPKPAEVGALAYAQGNEIHLGPGQEQHLPHEAWHVVQQRQGRVRPTAQAAGVAVNDDPGLEHEADAMGARALRQPAPDRVR